MCTYQFVLFTEISKLPRLQFLIQAERTARRCCRPPCHRAIQGGTGQEMIGQERTEEVSGGQNRTHRTGQARTGEDMRREDMRRENTRREDRR